MVALTDKAPRVQSPERYRGRMRMSDAEYRAAFAAMMASAWGKRTETKKEGDKR